MGTLVVDAWALVGYMRDESCAADIEILLKRAALGEVALAIASVNWGEVVYRVARQHAVAVEAVVARLDLLPIEIVPADRDMTILAARLKAERRLDYADSFAAALALSLDAPLMTGDPHFRELLPELSLEWVGE